MSGYDVGVGGSGGVDVLPDPGVSWAADTLFEAGARIVFNDALGSGVFTTSSGGTSGSDQPNFVSVVPGGTIVDNEITWEFIGYVGQIPFEYLQATDVALLNDAGAEILEDPGESWTVDIDYPSHSRIAVDFGDRLGIFRSDEAGTSGGVEPEWVTVLPTETIADNTVSWTFIGYVGEFLFSRIKKSVQVLAGVPRQLEGTITGIAQGIGTIDISQAQIEFLLIIATDAAHAQATGRIGVTFDIATAGEAGEPIVLPIAAAIEALTEPISEFGYTIDQTYLLPVDYRVGGVDGKGFLARSGNNAVLLDIDGAPVTTALTTGDTIQGGLTLYLREND